MRKSRPKRPDGAKNKRDDAPRRDDAREVRTKVVKSANIGGSRISWTDKEIAIESDEEEIDGVEELARNIFAAISGGSASRGIPLSTDFYVYESGTANRARVHKADCGICRHGEGSRRRRKSKSPDGSVRWHGPYDTRESAFSAMKGLGRKDIGVCSVCNP